VKSAEIYNEYNTQSIQVDPPAKKHDSEDWVGEDKPSKNLLTNSDEFRSSDKQDAIIKITNNLYLADLKSAWNEKLVRSVGISHAINLVAHEESKLAEEIICFNACLRDSPGWDILSVIEQIIDFISAHEQESDGFKVMFFCKKGVSRSVSCLAGYLMHKYKINATEALSMIRTKKSTIDPNIGFVGQLKKLEERLYSPSSIETSDTFAFSGVSNSNW
jgi:atypical dual specificity phosphatase